VWSLYGEYTTDGTTRMVAQIQMEIGLFSKVSRTSVGPNLYNVY